MVILVRLAVSGDQRGAAIPRSVRRRHNKRRTVCPRELGRVPPFRLAVPHRFDHDSIFQHLDELDTERLDGR
jgi:hypothetical protein